LTHVRLWKIPWGHDESFNFFVMQGGLENEALGDRRLEELFQTGGKESLLSKHIQAVQVLDPVARNLLQEILSPNPRNRPEVDEIINHPVESQRNLYRCIAIKGDAVESEIFCVTMLKLR
jgi:serine/threonine protein kinase